MNSILFIDGSLLQIDIHMAPNPIFSDRSNSRSYIPNIIEDRFHQSTEITQFPYQYGMIKRSLDHFGIDIITLQSDVIWVRHLSQENFAPLDNAQESLAISELKDLGFNVVVLSSDILTGFTIYEGPIWD